MVQRQGRPSDIGVAVNVLNGQTRDDTLSVQVVTGTERVTYYGMLHRASD